jgi:hypothetical protein
LRRRFLLTAALPVLARLARLGTRLGTLLAPRFDSALLANASAASRILDRGEITPHPFDDWLRVMHLRLDRDRMSRPRIRAAIAIRHRRALHACALDDRARRLSMRRLSMFVDARLRRRLDLPIVVLHAVADAVSVLPVHLRAVEMSVH